MTKKLFRTAVALASAFALAVPLGSAAFAAPPSQDDLEKKLGDHIIDKENAKKRYLVTLKNDHGSNTKATANERLREQAYRLASWRQKYGLTVHRQLSFLANSFSASMTPAMAQKLRQEPSVLVVEEQQKFYPQENHARIQQGLTQALEQSGLDGRGLVVSVVDTGIDPSHPDLTLSEEQCAAGAIKTIKAGFTCKVPFGHNYADENENTVDSDPHPHGQHVAGIVGANGKVKGMAPGAQLLAMKVFSNEGSGAWDVDIYAAVEDSVKLGADVINMSLGSDNGVFFETETGKRVLDAARAAGVLPVISAGNSGQNFSEDGRLGNARGQVDDSTLGSPGSFPAAFTVASVENNTNTDFKATVKTASGETFDVSYSHSFGTRDGNAHELVDVGNGEKSDYEGKDVAGKYVFMARTDQLSYEAKAKWAKEAGAAGIVAFNRPKGGNHTFTLYDVPSDYPLVGVGLRRDEGLKVREALANGKAEITLTEELRYTDSPDTGKASDFTSWGGPADLSFKPEIAGVGGFIYSLANGTGYGNMSGTSMSSPNIAGLSALALQRIREKDPSLSRQDALALAEQLIINTAQVIYDGEIPLPVRRIGSGLAQIDRVVASDVTATVDGDAALALREISGPRTVTVTLTNRGKVDRAFSIPTPTVYREAVQAGAETKLVESESSFGASAGQVTVPAGGTATVDFTLQPAGAQGSFLEGWLNFESQDEKQPDLQVPYYGFYGDWSAETMFATADNLLSEDLPDVYSQLQTSIPGFMGPQSLPLEGIGSRPLAISPNGDGVVDEVTPLVTLLRNLGEYDVVVTDANGTEVRTIEKGDSLRRSTLAGAFEKPEYASNELASFNGVVYDPTSGEATDLPDGVYAIRVDGRMYTGGKTQSISFPFTIDRIAPEITFGEPYEEDGGRYVDVTITDEGSGVFVEDTPEDSFVEFYNNGDEDDLLEWEYDGDKTYKVELLDDTATVLAAASDYGLNETRVNKIISDKTFIVNYEEELETEVLGNKTGVEDGKLTLEGYAGDSVAAVEANGVKATLENGAWKVEVPVEDGANTIQFVTYDENGAELETSEITVNVDAFTPEFIEVNWDSEGVVAGNEDGTATIKGKITQQQSATDPHHEGTTTVRVAELLGDFATTGEVAPDGSFSIDVDTNEMILPVVTIVADDGANETTELLIIDVPAAEGEDEGEEDTSAEAKWELNEDLYCLQGILCVVEPTDKGLTTNGDGSGTYKLTGTGTPGLKIAFTPRGGLVGNDYVYPAPVETVIGADGTFALDLPFNTNSINKFRVVVTTPEGETVTDKSLSFLWDTKNVDVHFATPQLLDGALFINQKDTRVPFQGVASDNGLSYNVSVNGDVVAGAGDLSNVGNESNVRAFNYLTRKLNDGNKVLVTTDDAFGNAAVATIPVVLDDVKPVITGAEGSPLRLTAPTTLNFKAADKYLTTFNLLVDGQPAKNADRLADLKIQNIEDVLEPVPFEEPEEEESSEETAEEGTGEDAATGAASAVAAAETAAAPAASTPQPLTSAEREAVRATAISYARNAAPAADTAAASSAEEATLALDYDTSALASGEHKLVLEARDFAGNVTYETLTVVVDKPAVIDGPDTTDLTVDAADQNNQEKLAELVLAAYKLVDEDGAYGLDGQPATGETSLTLAEGTVLVPGANLVKLIGKDAAGNTVVREVTVNITVKPAAQPGSGNEQPGAGGAGGGSGAAGGAGSASGAKGALAETGTPAGYSLAAALLLAALGVVGLTASTGRRREA